MKQDQIKEKEKIKSILNKITENINIIKHKINSHHSTLIDSNINKSRALTNNNKLNIKEGESNKRNRFGFPLFFK
tara:strand:+ start:236 stop:460 length:225 start_codon:yes stop_codon:yes gene_type:complete